MLGTEGAEYFTVLVERGESAEHRRLRTMVLWGLTDREAEVLSLVGDGKTGPEIAILLAISHDTVANTPAASSRSRGSKPAQRPHRSRATPTLTRPRWTDN